MRACPDSTRTPSAVITGEDALTLTLSQRETGVIAHLSAGFIAAIVYPITYRYRGTEQKKTPRAVISTHEGQGDTMKEKVS